MTKFKVSGRNKQHNESASCPSCKQHNNKYYYTIVTWAEPWEANKTGSWYVCSVRCANYLMLMVM